VNADR